VKKGRAFIILEDGPEKAMHVYHPDGTGGDAALIPDEAVVLVHQTLQRRPPALLVDNDNDDGVAIQGAADVGHYNVAVVRNTDAVQSAVTAAAKK
jgi:hypothetical protein